MCYTAVLSVPLLFVTPLYVLVGLTLAGIGFIAWKLSQTQGQTDPHLKAELERRQEQIGELKNQLSEEKSKIDELSGKGKEMYDRFKTLEAEYKALQKEREGLVSRVSKYEASEDQRDKKQTDHLGKLEAAKQALEDERLRVRRDDEARLQAELEARDRLWAEHEFKVLSRLAELCIKPELKFATFDNTNLPNGFHGTLKPDFLIEFLNQYVIFDAKISKSSNLQVYIADQVKKTAQKVKGKENIYPTIFLVVPTDAIHELKKTSYYEGGITFYVISPEALEPILGTLKRIESYEFAQEMDPQQRENIVDIIAHLHHHISYRNAADTIMTEHGVQTLERIGEIDNELETEVRMKREKIRPFSFGSTTMKALASDPEAVRQTFLELTKPKAKIQQEELDTLL